MILIGDTVPPDPTRDRFDQLVRSQHAAVHAYIRRRVRDPARAEDLTQDVFLRAWRHADAFDASRADARGWLLAIARNLVIDSYRAEGRRPTVSGVDEFLAAVPAADEIDAALGALAMSEALQRLTEAHRTVLVYLYYRGWSLADTASHLGIAVGTVKSRSTYALRALKLVLEELEGDA